MAEKWISPRDVPERDAKYMALAFMYAGFSKDPNTQMGAQIVSEENEPLGAGYNGPSKKIDDRSFSWRRHDPSHPDRLSKHDVMIHAEINAIRHSRAELLPNSTLYITGYPCKACMNDIVDSGIIRVVYLDYRYQVGSMLLDDSMRKVSEEIAHLGGIRVEKFNGSLLWMLDHVEKLKELGIFDLH